MIATDQLTNIAVRHGDDGFWLCVKSRSGKQGMISLSNMKGLVGQAFEEWAGEQFPNMDLLMDITYVPRPDGR